MVVNSALEASPENPELRDATANKLGLIEAFFRDRTVAGQTCREMFMEFVFWRASARTGHFSPER